MVQKTEDFGILGYFKRLTWAFKKWKIKKARIIVKWIFFKEFVDHFLLKLKLQQISNKLNNFNNVKGWTLAVGCLTLF